jgi:hypothetical protein
VPLLESVRLGYPLSGLTESRSGGGGPFTAGAGAADADGDGEVLFRAAAAAAVGAGPGGDLFPEVSARALATRLLDSLAYRFTAPLPSINLDPVAAAAGAAAGAGTGAATAAKPLRVRLLTNLGERNDQGPWLRTRTFAGLVVLAARDRGVGQLVWEASSKPASIEGGAAGSLLLTMLEQACCRGSASRPGDVKALVGIVSHACLATLALARRPDSTAGVAAAAGAAGAAMGVSASVSGEVGLPIPGDNAASTDRVQPPSVHPSSSSSSSSSSSAAAAAAAAAAVAVSEAEVVDHALLQMDVEARQHGGTPLWVLDEGMCVCVHHVCVCV